MARAPRHRVLLRELKQQVAPQELPPLEHLALAQDRRRVRRHGYRVRAVNLEMTAETALQETLGVEQINHPAAD